MTQKTHQGSSELALCMMAQGWATSDLDREITKVRQPSRTKRDTPVMRWRALRVRLVRPVAVSPPRPINL